MTAFLIVNPRAGRGDPAALVERATTLGIGVHVLGPGDDPTALARAADASVLAVAGGDGSLAQVAAVALERDLPFGVVPTGTRNHFARDARLPFDAADALTVLLDGSERPIDLAWANRRPFLNNVSLGMYAWLVHRRESGRRRREAFARLRALSLAARGRRPLDLTVNGASVRARVLLVANNAYRLDMLSLGARERLDEGVLHVYSSAGLLRTSWSDRSAERLVVEAASARLPAAVDGDPDLFETPIEFRIDARALRLLIPRGPDREDLVEARESEVAPTGTVIA